MGFGHFVSTPGIFAHDPPKTLDGGIGLYGYLKGAKAYVLNDEAFGLIGVGCRAETAAGGAVRAFPTDGLKKRLRFVEAKVDIEAVKGELGSVTYDKAAGSLEIEMSDPTRLADKAELIINGLGTGDFKVTAGEKTETLKSTGELKVVVPILDAGKIRIEQIKQEKKAGRLT
jgi:hypothetical protein